MPGPRFWFACLLLLVAAAALVLGRAQPSAASQGARHVLPASGGTESGRLIFLSDCAYCHGTNGTGTQRGPTLQRVGAAAVDFYLSTGRMPVAEEVQDPQRKAPAYDSAKIARIVSYVDSLGAAGGPAVPQLDLAIANLSEGGELYTENCASCHSSVGAGGALANGRYAPTLRPSTPTQIAEAIRIGPGTMPVFGSDTLTDDQVNAIVRYVVYLQRPEDRGGLGLGHIGPITEGMIALVVGLGALLLLIRRIGTAVGD